MLLLAELFPYLVEFTNVVVGLAVSVSGRVY
jgi:hypothetical protein